GNARAATVAACSRDAASRAWDRSGAPDSASHGASAETAACAAHGSRRSRQDDDTAAAATRSAADNDSTNDAERDHNRGPAGRAVAAATAVAQHPQQRADSSEREQEPGRALLHHARRDISRTRARHAAAGATRAR